MVVSYMGLKLTYQAIKSKVVAPLQVRRARAGSAKFRGGAAHPAGGGARATPGAYDPMDIGAVGKGSGKTGVAAAVGCSSCKKCIEAFSKHKKSGREAAPP